MEVRVKGPLPHGSKLFQNRAAAAMAPARTRKAARGTDKENMTADTGRTGGGARLGRIFDYLPARRRWQSVVMLGLMLAGAFAEVLTLGAILPFLALMANPGAAQSVPALRIFLSFIGLKPGPDLIVVLGLIFCGVVVVTAGVRIFLAWVTQKFVFRIGYDLGVAVYQRILYQPYHYHVSHSSSTILATINKVQNVVNGVMMPLMQAVSSAVIAISILIGLLVINPVVAVACAVVFGSIYILVSVLSRRRLSRNSRIIARAFETRMQTVQEGVGGIRDVLLDHAQPQYVNKFKWIDSSLRDAQATNAMIYAAPRFVIEGLGMILIVLLALFLSRGPGGLVAALPVLGALALGAQRLLPLLQIIYNGWTQYMGNQASFNDIFEALALPIAPVLIAPDAVVPLPFERAISFDAVSFRYADDQEDVIRDLSLVIPKGSRVGFVGKTGSGKSTVIDLMLGLLTPTRGDLSVDGVPIGPDRIKPWQAQIAHVPQSIYLSDATIIENIAFGVPRDQIDEDRVRRAARDADIADHIDAQPKGYDTIVGERGVRLSGGQRQRIGIARALYKRSELLIFDEATSALDDQTETSVIRAIEGLGRDLTIVMIAHRVTTLRNCDLIYRLSEGRVVESGGYAEVIEGNATAVLAE